MVALEGDRVGLGLLPGREVPVDLAVSAKIAAQRRRQNALLVAAHRRRGDQLIEGRVARRQLELAGRLQVGRPGPPVPEAGGVALQLDVLAVPQLAVVRVDRADGLRVERLVVGGQLCELQRPEERAERLAAPDRVDDRRVVPLPGEERQRGP